MHFSGTLAGRRALRRAPLSLGQCMPSYSKLNAESFIGLVKQSNLLDADVLKAAWDDVTSRGYDPTDARRVADDFVARKLLTRWQADKLLQRKHRGFFLGKYRLL